ncbi:MAG: PFL family protein [Desulfobacteraceae bacterium]|nr:MAG: PFL family protein [Desulfobacteraceae bacterium]
MLEDHEILSTIEMVKNENLDVRAVTLGVNLFDCISSDLDTFKSNIRKKIVTHAGHLVSTCDQVGKKYGIKVVNKRISTSPIALVGAAFKTAQLVEIAQELNDIARTVNIDFIGGFSALVEKGMATGDLALIEALPEALASTQRVCASVNVATTRAGINMDGVLKMAQTIKQAAALTADEDGLGCAKLCVFSNIPQDMPFMAGSMLGPGVGDAVINVGVSGPGVVKKAIERNLGESHSLTLGQIAELIKNTSCKVTRVGELIGREVAQELGVRFGVVDLSLAPTPTVGDSIGEIFQALGLTSIGVPGSTAALAMLNDAVKKGGAFASSHVGGLSGAFIPVSEDLNIARAAEEGYLSLEKLESMTCVCSVGLDMVPVPGDITEECLAGIIADEMAIGMINTKTTATRIIPVPGKKAGEKVYFGGLLGEASIMEVPHHLLKDRFVTFGGRIPAPIHSLKN